jgi:glycosyltransferase involved in cell wall biosynthesis
MKVLYDISVLAQAHRYAKARTGVFRVVDNVVRGLVESGECRVSFCVADEINDPVDFLAKDAQLRNVDLAIPESALIKLRLYRQIHQLTDKLESDGSGLRSASLKAFRKMLFHAAQLASFSGQAVKRSELARAEIFHSPFHPIPLQVRKVKTLKRFLTVYDLIPILHPEFFGTNLVRGLPEIINSLGPEDFALCISKSTRDDLCSYRPDLDPARVFVTHLAASELFYRVSDEERLTAVRSKYNIPADVPYLLSLGTLEPRKNIEHVIKCFAKLVREQNIRDLQLVLVGVKGWDYDGIFSALNALDVRERIIVTGYVEDEDLAPLYSGAIGFVYLSLYEGFGLPPLEAMQCGVPVITSNNSSLPEVVGEAGIMIDALDEDAACQSILDVYRDDKLRAEMSERSIQRAEEFSWERCTRETISAYKCALNN